MLLSVVSPSQAKDFALGDSVVVVSENTAVMVGEQKMGTVPRGTEFKIRQLAPSWLMGEFQVGNRLVLGWVDEDVVGPARPGFQESSPYDFNWENLLLAAIKLNKRFDFEAHVDDYLRAFRADVWKKYRNDEFRLHNKRAEALPEFQERVADFDLDREFVIFVNLTMEKYDFARSAFPIEEATDTHYWYEYRYVDGDFPREIKVFFENPELMGCVSLSPDAAEGFLATRKDSRGNVDRTIYAKVYIRMVSRKKGDNELLSEIRWVQFFSDNQRKKLLYETPRIPVEPPVNEETKTTGDGQHEEATSR